MMDGVTRTLAYTSDKNGNRYRANLARYLRRPATLHDGLDRMTTLYQGADQLDDSTWSGYTLQQPRLRADADWSVRYAR